MTKLHVQPRLWFIAGLAVFSALYWWGMIAHDNTLTFRDDLSDNPSWLRENISIPIGSTLREALALQPGETRRLVYDFSVAPEATCRVRLNVGENVTGELRELWSIDGVPDMTGWTLVPGPAEVDLTPFLPPTGLVRLAIDVSLPLGHPPVQGVDWFEITVSTPRTLHWHALIFFFVLGATIWVGLPALLIAESRVWWDRTWFRIAVVSLGVAGALLLMPSREVDGVEESLMWGPKYFDDIRAVSNAALMVTNGGDVDQLYFRSRLRPGYLAHMMPLVLAFPQGMIRAQYGPGIFSDVLWREFDRIDGTFATFRHLEISALAWLEGMALALALALVWRRFGCGTIASWLAATFAVVGLSRVLYNPLTIIWNLFIAACAVLAVLRMLDKPSMERALLAGAILAVCALTKITALMTFAPLALLWIGRTLSRGQTNFHSRLRIALIALVIGVMLTLWWFEGFLGGLRWELAMRRAQIPAVMQMHPEFPLRSWEVAKQALWALAGWGWILVALGLTLGVRRPRLAQPQEEADSVWLVSREAWTFALLWALSGTMAFLMPFLFPRFLKYMAPGLGLVAASGICTVVWWTTRLIRGPRHKSDSELGMADFEGPPT